MKYVSWLGVATLALIAASCASTAYDNGTPASSRNNDVTDFNGQWQLVENRSDNGQNWLDDRSSFNRDGDWDNTSGSTERMRYGAWFLPDEFRISGDRQTLRIEDNGGAVIADVAFDSGNQYGSYDNGDATDRSPRAHWMSHREFQVERVGRRGRRVMQTYTLGNRGRQLVVRTQIDRDGSTRSYTRVYDRV
jgi:hypothetical protein